MTRIQRIGVLTLCAVLAVGSLVPALLNGAAPTRSPAAAPATAPAVDGRTAQVILSDLRTADAELRTAMPSLMALTDPAFRSGQGQKAIAPLKKMASLFGELEKVAPNAEARESVRTNRFRVYAYAALLGDKDSLTTLENAAKGTGAEAISAKTGLAMIAWLSAAKDPAAQAKVLDDVTAMAKANPESAEVAESLGFMANVGAANNDLTRKAIEIIRTNLKGDDVKAMLAELDADQAQKDFVGKPFAIEGRTSTGGTFNTDSLKGKVVLIDFWATWCGPCIAELPNVKKAYADLHDKGFEIVGVSCDAGDTELNNFIKENGMTWTQLREASQNEKENWHPLAKRYGVNGIPQMFLIDKKGVLRYVDAREDLATKAKLLLAEGDATTKPAAMK